MFGSGRLIKYISTHNHSLKANRVISCQAKKSVGQSSHNVSIKNFLNIKYDVWLAWILWSLLCHLSLWQRDSRHGRRTDYLCSQDERTEYYNEQHTLLRTDDRDASRQLGNSMDIKFRKIDVKTIFHWCRRDCWKGGMDKLRIFPD